MNGVEHLVLKAHQNVPRWHPGPPHWRASASPKMAHLGLTLKRCKAPLQGQAETWDVPDAGAGKPPSAVCAKAASSKFWPDVRNCDFPCHSARVGLPRISKVILRAHLIAALTA